MVNHEFVKQLEYRLRMVRVGKALSDKNAYELYQVAKILFDWFSEQCKPKLRRYLIHREGVQPMKKYNPHKCYDDFFDDEISF